MLSVVIVAAGAGAVKFYRLVLAETGSDRRQLQRLCAEARL